MQVRATLTAKEVGEANGLIKDGDYWKRMVLTNLRLVVVVLVLLYSLIDATNKGKQITVGLLLGEAGVLAFLIAMIWLRLYSRNSRDAKVNNATAGTLSVDQDGLRAVSTSGATSFEPWTMFTRSAEGKRVFRLKGKTAARTIPKELLSTLDTENIRNLISVNVRPR